jgi:hypothetical protein
VRTSLRGKALVAAVLVLLAPAGVAAYQEITLTNAGELGGAVRYTGPLLPPLEVAAGGDQKGCGQTIPSHFFRVGGTRGVRDAIVTIEGISSGKAWSLAGRPVLAARNCQFEPHTLVVPVGGSVDLLNEDPIRHNAHAVLDEGATLFNLVLPMKGFRVPRVFDAAGLVRVTCEAGHPWSKAYVLVSDHPYCAVTDSLGAFSMPQVPPGTYRVRTWHEAFEPQEQEVTIRPGARTDIAIQYTAPPTLPSDVRTALPSEDEF